MLLQSSKTAAKETPKATVVVKKQRKSNNKPITKATVKAIETPEQKRARDAEAAKLKATEEAARKIG